MAKRLEGKVAIVTGAGQTPGDTVGNGRAISILFAREGARVMLVDRNLASAEETQAMIAQEGGTAFAFQADITKADDCRKMADTCAERYGQIDILVNNVGTGGRDGTPVQVTEETWDRVFDINLKSMYLTCKSVLPFMEARESGAIVNISSNSSLRGQAYNTAYAAAKGGVNILTKSSAAEYGAQGIRINAVSPGVIRTPGVEKYFAEQPKMAEGLKKAAVMNRLGEPEEIAEAVTFLSSDRASFITGQILSVDGGGAVR